MSSASQDDGTTTAVNARRPIGRRSLDEFVGPDENGLGNREPKRLRGLEIDDQVELGGLPDGKTHGLAPFKILSTYHADRLTSSTRLFHCACDKALRYVVDHVAFLSLQSSEWARAYYNRQRARGHSHHQAFRALGAKWLKIIFVMWQHRVPYDEQYHLATMTRQQLRHHQNKIA